MLKYGKNTSADTPKIADIMLNRTKTEYPRTRRDADKHITY